ncbi:MAG: hypothetical protein IPF69_12985 [Chitinophagaceae bacterium]|nr:hypothetical protein [Chitinophagaceae bacterium]
MTKGLFINNVKAQDSIYESGLMVYNCLKLSRMYTLEYVEISREQPEIPVGFDFYFFNYHPSTMAWMDTSGLKKTLGLVITMVLEVLPGDPFVMCPDTHFHGYCVLDPTIRSRNKYVFAFPRPLEKIDYELPYMENEIPVIGSFGFATKGKGFQHVVEAVNKEFNKAIVKINIPYGDFVPKSKEYAMFLAEVCKNKAKEGIEVIITHEYMEKKALIEWCARNTLNCFLYDRNLPGLAATTDQAIVAGRPLSVSNNDTFRHILAYLKPYPEMSLRTAIAESSRFVKQMQYDWSPDSFMTKFEEILPDLINKRKPGNVSTDRFILPVVKKSITETIKKKYRKYKRYFSISKINHVIANRKKVNNEELI